MMVSSQELAQNANCKCLHLGDPQDLEFDAAESFILDDLRQKDISLLMSDDILSLPNLT